MAGRFGRSGGARRKLVWDVSLITPFQLAPNAVTTYDLITNVQVLDDYAQRPTVAAIYGRVWTTAGAGETAGDVCAGAWGIRWIEDDVTPNTSVYSPLADGDTTDWITWRGWSHIYSTSDDLTFQRSASSMQVNDFMIRNPRKGQPDQSLSFVCENAAGGNMNVLVGAWFRTAVLLP